MTKAHIAKVIGDSITIVNVSSVCTLILLIISSNFSHYEISKIKTFKRELDMGVNLLAVAATSVHTE